MWNVFTKNILKKNNMSEHFSDTDSMMEVQTKKGVLLTMLESDIHSGQDGILDRLNHGITVASDAFGVNLGALSREEEHVFAMDVVSHLVDHHVIFAYNLQGEPEGFGSFDMLREGNKNILYVSGLVIKKESQKHGMGTEIVKQAIQSARTMQPVDYVAGRTQNPAVAQARLHYCDPVYPLTAPVNDEVVQIGLAVHRHLKMRGPMDPVTLVTRNAYENPLTAIRPQSKLPAINAFFDQYVGPRDAAFIIGRPTI